ncbi:MAG: hypothetical protein DWP98_00470 [Bacteroidetes bacterium]|nr:MAG: hypothetical protein DWP98_00470 [Bacteroidota bacterium]MBL1143654.1 hypothetical protein [Bacteroidota bacterium]NOG56456.1 hypothetical protein [Bacteroidota bacterium]
MLNKIKRYSTYFLSQIFFLFNTVFLIAPITWINILALLGVKKSFNKKTLIWAISFLSFSFFYGFIHFNLGVDSTVYIKSSFYYLVLLFTGFSSYNYLRELKSELHNVFIFNLISIACLFLIGLLILKTPISYFLWQAHDFIGEGEDTILRFKGFFYEPSYLAYICSPLAIFAFLLFINKSTFRHFCFVIAIFLPIVFTFSFGFFAAFGLSIIFTITVVAIQFRQIRKVFLLPLLLCTIGLVAVANNDNSISKRIEKIFQGEDTSVNGRTNEAFYLAHQCAAQKSLWFGIGPGQIKVIGEEVIRPYYAKRDPIGYQKENWPTIAIPNSAAETLAIYGYLGLFLRISLQLFLFFKFNVSRNYFNLCLFSFVFIYQFMGSFITSTAELILWIIAILPLFKEFEIIPSKKFKLT